MTDTNPLRAEIEQILLAPPYTRSIRSSGPSVDVTSIGCDRRHRNCAVTALP